MEHAATKESLYAGRWPPPTPASPLRFMTSARTTVDAARIT